MRLIDFDPSWIKVDGLEGVGVKFLCPCCRKAWIHILFLNTLSAVPSLPDSVLVPGNNSGNRWSRSGMDFSELSLSPDVDCEKSGHGKWRILHGEIFSL